MKVLYITNMLPVPDYIYFGVHVKEQIDDLVRGHEVDADVYFINGRAKKGNYLKSIWEIRQKIKENNYDLIHVHYGLAAIFLMFVPVRTPVVVTLHSGELFQKKGYINHLVQKFVSLNAVKKANRVIVLNDEMISLLHKYENKLSKIPCGVNAERFVPAVQADNSPIIRIGFPGNRARPEKNYALFSDITSTLAEKYRIEVIEFHGLTREEVLGSLQKIDLLLMTSKVEGSPQIVKEALCCNKPVVSTTVGDVPDLLTGVRNCHVVNSFRTLDFIQPIESVLQHNKADRSSNGRERIAAMQLQSDQVADRIFHLYKSLN